MGKERVAKPREEGQGRWPFDPHLDPTQPGDHEPVQLPEELERIQKQTGRGRKGSHER